MIVISVYSLSKKIIFPLSLSVCLSLSLYYSILFLQIFSSYKQILILSSIILKHRDCILQSFKKIFTLKFILCYISLLSSLSFVYLKVNGLKVERVIKLSLFKLLFRRVLLQTTLLYIFLNHICVCSIVFHLFRRVLLQLLILLI